VSHRQQLPAQPPLLALHERQRALLSGHTRAPPLPLRRRLLRRRLLLLLLLLLTVLADVGAQRRAPIEDSRIGAACGE
jgi:hypothetical protein